MRAANYVWEMVIVVIIGARMANTLGCSATLKRGPFRLIQQDAKIKAPTRIIRKVERLVINANAEMAVMYRSYWKSYCYQGGSLDGNTGCFNGIHQDLPAYKETDLWIEKNQCAVGKDCVGCAGQESDHCLNMRDEVKKWVDEKELTKHENNNNFARHTCNVSWRCAIKKIKYPTFAYRLHNTWVLYTEMLNGTEMRLSAKDFWVFDDLVIRKIKEPEIRKEEKEVPCFKKEDKNLACYDEEKGNFVEFKKGSACIKQVCYALLEGTETTTESEEMPTLADLKAASNEDLRDVIATEHMLNEELRYNFGLVLQELADIQKIMIKIIISTAKVDDKLIGNVIGQPSRSKFLTEESFTLTPCEASKIENSTCQGNSTFRNGRWQPRTSEDYCTNITKVEEIKIMEATELWLPNIIDHKQIGTIDNFEGWSYYVKEQDGLRKNMEWTKSVRASTSLKDVLELPDGFLNQALAGFLTSHVIIFVSMLAVLVIYIRRKCTTWRRKDGRNREIKELIEGNQNRIIERIVVREVESTPELTVNNGVGGRRDTMWSKQSFF